MTEADKHGCATCKWAKFQMTSHKPPRINKRVYGECSWPIPKSQPLPLCVIPAERLHRCVIWAHMINCPVWEKKA